MAETRLGILDLDHGPDLLFSEPCQRESRTRRGRRRAPALGPHTGYRHLLAAHPARLRLLGPCPHRPEFESARLAGPECHRSEAGGEEAGPGSSEALCPGYGRGILD